MKEKLISTFEKVWTYVKHSRLILPVASATCFMIGANLTALFQGLNYWVADFFFCIIGFIIMDYYADHVNE